MRKIVLLLITAFIFNSAKAQRNGSVEGIAFDTISRQPVSGATITILDKKDSSLVSFTMTDHQGKFTLKGLPNGEFRMLITHTGYHNSNVYFTIGDSQKAVDMGNVVMNDKVKVLAEVVLGNEAPPVTMINDTIQYNAGSFKVAPNSNVEQLLKKLPGVKVEKDGTVKAQGETVNRILVDGKEFFGTDPKVATRNLPADAVDKVQVYDRQSEQASLTGFEDGEAEKTINLKLKADKKKGIFGKANAGVGNDGRYAGKFNLNSFKGARQFSALAMGNNTNEEGFSFMDILNFTGELARMQRGMGGGGNINITLNANDAAALGINPGGRNAGINTSWAGGLNYNNIIGTRFDLQSNYFFNRFNPRTESTIERQYLLPDSTYFSNSFSRSNNLSNNHRFNMNLLFQVDSMNSIRWTPSVNLQSTSNRSYSDYTTLSGAKLLANRGFSENESESNGHNFRNDLMWRKKFARKGRTFSLSLNTTLNKSEGEGSLYSINSFYNNGTLFRQDTLDQRSFTESDLRGYSARAVYTEPLWKRSLLEFSVGKSSTRSTSEKLTYDFNDNSKLHDMLNEQLSNDFENTYSYWNGGIRLRTQRKKYNYSVGATWQKAELEGEVITGLKDSVIGKTFTNILPNARFQYNFSRFRSLSVNYSTSTNQPSASQLQPVPDNSNPLSIRSGNPDLRQEFSHNLQANLNLVSPYKNKNFFLFLNFQATENRIVNYDSVGNFGVKYTKPVNVNGTYNMNSSVSYSLPLRFLSGSVEFAARTSFSKSKQFINREQNEIRNFGFGPEIRLNLNPTDELSLGASAEMNLNNTRYSLHEALNNRYFSYEYNAFVDWQLPKKFFLSTDFTYTVNSQLASGFNLKVPIWNASLSRQMLNYNRGELKLSVADILNENVGVRRNTSNNYIEDTRSMTLKRYFLLSFTYNLTKVGLGASGRNEGGMRVRM